MHEDDKPLGKSNNSGRINSIFECMKMINLYLYSYLV